MAAWGATELQGGGDGKDRPAGWARAFRQLFDPHPSHVALVGLDGTILAVNEAWTRFGRLNGLRADYDFVGQNYLAHCEAAVGSGTPGAQEAYVGLLDVIRNGRPKFTQVYPCHSPARREWYRMWVEPQTPTVAAVIVAHQLVASEPWPSGEAAGHGGWADPFGPAGVFDARRGFPR